MYRNFAQLREGWTKNLALLFPAPVRLAALRAIEFVLIAASTAVAISAALRGSWQPAAAAGMLAVIMYGLFLKRISRAHFAWDANLLAVFGLPLFSYFLLGSKSAHATGTVAWKGREYSDERRSLATGH
jgi:hypothetical protein